jgi:hypothetical protein
MKGIETGCSVKGGLCLDMKGIETGCGVRGGNRFGYLNCRNILFWVFQKM